MKFEFDNVKSQLTLNELILIGDRVLIKPDELEGQTPSGLYLPATVREKERVHSGRVVRVGPGYVVPNPDFSEDEPWAAPKQSVRYLALQAREGDFAFYLRKEAIEIEFQQMNYMIVPHHAILALIREQPDEIDLYE